MDSDFKQQHHEEQERGKQLETPLLPAMSAPAAAPAASGGRSKTLLWSFAALFIAAAAVIVAFLLLKQKEAPEQPADPSAAIVHEPRDVTQPVAKETSRQLGSDNNVDDQKKRAAAHIARAKKQIKLRKWRAALFFLDQVLILDSEHAEARRLLSFVERKATGKTTVASAMDPQPGSAAAVEAPKRPPGAAVAIAPTRKARPPVKRGRTRMAMRSRARRARPAPKPVVKPRPAKVKPAVVKPAITLRPARIKQAGLQVTSTPTAMVYLDGIPLGNTPLKGIRLAPGLHNVKLVEAGYLAYVKEVTLESGQERLLDVKLQPKPKKPAVVAARKPKPARKAAPPKKAVAVAAPAPAPKPVTPAPQTSGVNFLPRIVKVRAYNRDGKRTKEISRALAMVEQAAGRASNKDATGTTSGLRTFMYGAHRGAITPIPLYPRRMGLIITSALNKGKSKGAISSSLVHLYRTKALKP